jgi:hypothetical protein
MAADETIKALNCPMGEFAAYLKSHNQPFPIEEALFDTYYAFFALEQNKLSNAGFIDTELKVLSAHFQIENFK